MLTILSNADDGEYQEDGSDAAVPGIPSRALSPMRNFSRFDSGRSFQPIGLSTLSTRQNPVRQLAQVGHLSVNAPVPTNSILAPTNEAQAAAGSAVKGKKRSLDEAELGSDADEDLPGTKRTKMGGSKRPVVNRRGRLNQINQHITQINNHITQIGHQTDEIARLLSYFEADSDELDESEPEPAEGDGSHTNAASNSVAGPTESKPSRGLKILDINGTTTLAGPNQSAEAMGQEEAEPEATGQIYRFNGAWWDLKKGDKAKSWWHSGIEVRDAQPKDKYVLS